MLEQVARLDRSGEGRLSIVQKQNTIDLLIINMFQV